MLAFTTDELAERFRSDVDDKITDAAGSDADCLWSNYDVYGYMTAACDALSRESAGVYRTIQLPITAYDPNVRLPSYVLHVREAERKFMAFAHDDPAAKAAYKAMRGAKGDVAEATVPWTVAAEGLPVVGKVVKVAKLGSILRDWARERAAGSPVTFRDIVQIETGASNQAVRDLMGTAGARGATMQ